MEEKNSHCIDVGWKNYVIKTEIVAIIDARTGVARRLKTSVKARSDTALLDLTMGKKSASLIVLKGNRYIISAIPRMQLVTRLDARTSHNEPIRRPVGRPRKPKEDDGE